MRALAEYTMRGRAHATMVVAFLGSLTWFFPPVSYLSGAAYGLCVLRRGMQDAIRIGAWAVLIAGAMSLVSFGNPKPAIALAFVLWIPVWIGAQVLRKTGSQGDLVVTAALMALAFALFMHVTTGGAAAWWQAEIERVLKTFASADYQAADLARTKQFIAYANGFVAALMVINLSATVILARWWQSILYNPGGFRDEFHALQVRRWLLPIAGLAVVAAMLETNSGQLPGLASDATIIVIAVYLFQGLAVIHHRGRRQGLSVGWFVALYGFLFVAWQLAIPFVAMVGIGDVLLDLRGLRGRNGTNGV